MDSLFLSVMAVLANADWIPFLIALLIGVPSAVLYCLELALIVTNFAEFGAPFFVLVAVRAASSLVNYVFSFLALRFGVIGLFLPVYLKMPRVVLASFLFTQFYTFHFENFIHTFLLLNRFTAILLPTNYDKLWRRGLSFCVVVTLLLPLPLTIPIFNLDIFIHVQHNNVSFTFDEHKTANDNFNYSEIAAWSAVLFVIICLLLNLAILFAYKIRHFGKQNDQSSAFEHKMTIYTVVTFFGELTATVFMLIIYVTATTLVDEQNNRYSLAQKWFGITLEEDDILFLANFNQYPWINDVAMVAIPAWLLLWASTKMREIIFSKFNRIGQSKQNVVTLKNAVVAAIPTNQVCPR
uniref:Serpentine receptor class gamma n=1 Tax=Globodera rostochiensis TaxID=31243 RepID=A0A914ID91_GLORO